MKKYFAVIQKRTNKNAINAALVAGYERDGKVFRGTKLIGYALDFYPNEEARYRREYGTAIIGEFLTRAEAEEKVEGAMR